MRATIVTIAVVFSAVVSSLLGPVAWAADAAAPPPEAAPAEAPPPEAKPVPERVTQPAPAPSRPNLRPSR